MTPRPAPRPSAAPFEFAFSRFFKKRDGGEVDFSHKKGRAGKIGGCFKKEGYHLFSY